jgi:hypothetical protein
MAIYRPPRPRWPGVVASGIAGLVLGASGALAVAASRPPDVAEALATARASLLEARAVLEVAAVEYEESVQGGEVVRRAEYVGARDALRASRRAYLEARPALTQIAVASAARIDAAYEALDELMAAPAPAERVTARIQGLSALLRQTTGG